MESILAHLYLASASPRRQELIQTLGIPVTMCPSDVDESISKEYSPSEIVEILSLRKASAVYDKIKNEHFKTEEVKIGVIIGSDTIVVLENEVLGKPQDAEDAYRMLKSLQGQWHEVYTGVTCIELQSGQQQVRHRKTKVKMKPMQDKQIFNYIQTNEPFDKAGSYAIQGYGALIVEEIEGCYFNVVGLPLSLLHEMLTRYGIEVI